MNPNRQAAVLILGLFATISAVAAPPKYTATELSNVYGNGMEVAGINLYGTVVGVVSNTSGQVRGAIWGPNGITVLPTFGGENSAAIAIADTGEVVGYAQNASGVYQAFLYKDGTMVNLGKPTANSFAWGVSKNGVVCGRSGSDAVYWDADGMHIVGAFKGGNNSEAVGINPGGRILANCNTGGPLGDRAYIWLRGRFTLLFDKTVSCVGNAINNGTSITGRFYTGNKDQHAFFYQARRTTDLGTLGGKFSVGYGLNQANVVVGQSELPNLKDRAFIWMAGTMYDLNTFLMTPIESPLSIAVDINNKGYIIGGNNLGRWYLLKPVQ